MAVEIVEEEVAGDETIRSIDKDGKADVADHEGDMSRDFSVASGFKVPSSAIDDLLWTRIDLAESYLVSAMNEDAASTATTVLQTLCSLNQSSSSGILCSVSCSSSSSDRDDKGKDVDGAREVGKSVHEDMLECAGMVLLQSCRAIGRIGEFFDILRKLSLGVAEWPLILLETGACLQISDGACSAARAAIEEFLAVQSTCLLDEKYAELVELYVVKVLVEGFQETESAIDWVERANFTEERRLFILEKIQYQMEQAKTTEPVFQPDTDFTSTANGGTPSPSQASFDLQDLLEDKETKENNDIGWEAPTCPGADESSSVCKSITLLKRFKISEGFFSLKTLLELALARLNATSVWKSFSVANLEARALRFGALVAFFLFIFLRHRNTGRRLVEKSARALRVGVRDLWQLAFSVQINPLAAVNPISAAY